LGSSLLFGNEEKSNLKADFYDSKNLLERRLKITDPWGFVNNSYT